MILFKLLTRKERLEKMEGIKWIFLLMFVLFTLQSFGSIIQIRGYKKAIQRCRQLGNLGIGQKRSRLLSSGNIVIIGCDSEGVITGGEIMEGITLLAHFKPMEKILDRPMVGESIYDYLEEFRAMPKKRQKFYKGHIQAMEALEMRFSHAGEGEETSAEVIPVSDDEFDIDDL